jgi:hypothetical protein
LPVRRGGFWLSGGCNAAARQQHHHRQQQQRRRRWQRQQRPTARSTAASQLSTHVRRESIVQRRAGGACRAGRAGWVNVCAVAGAVVLPLWAVRCARLWPLQRGARYGTPGRSEHTRGLGQVGLGVCVCWRVAASNSCTARWPDTHRDSEREGGRHALSPRAELASSDGIELSV